MGTLRFAHPTVLVVLALAVGVTSPVAAQAPGYSTIQPSTLPLLTAPCASWRPSNTRRNPAVRELRCRFAVHGPGRFGLAEHMDVPVYQPVTPLPGTHLVGLTGMPRPRDGESYEEWEWRVHRTRFGPEVRQVHRSLDVLEPEFATRVREFESQLQHAGIRFQRRETWRSPERQAYLFQQGRSRPGAIVTATLTSWHSLVDRNGNPSARAVDYDVPRSHLERFHQYAAAFDFGSYGADSYDPGHIYMLGARDIDANELAYLRTLPRVPVVTISTGRPMDEVVTREERSEYRRLSQEWVSDYFIRPPAPGIALAWHVVPVVDEVAVPSALAADSSGVVETAAPAQAAPPGLLQSLLPWKRNRRVEGAASQ